MLNNNIEIPEGFEAVDIALNKFLTKLGDKTVEPEDVNVEDSLNRILYDNIVAHCDLPAYNKALADGYAVNSQSTATAEANNPVFFDIVGENKPDNFNVESIEKNQAVKVSMGGTLPDNADAVITLDHSIQEGDSLKVFKNVLSGNNIAKKGADISLGQPFIMKKRKIRPQDIGGILSIGYRKITVYKKPVISVIPTGSEIVSIYEEPSHGQVVSSNSYVLKGAISQLGGITAINHVVKDDIQALKDSISNAMNYSDMVIISGGSGNGSGDYTLEAIMSFENSKVIAHGIAMRPGRMTILAFIGDTPVIGLPGHPVSSLTSFLTFAKPAIVQLSGSPRSFWQEIKDNAQIDAVLAKDVESPLERVDFIRVRLKQQPDGKITAYPYAGKASFISTLAKAHGLIQLAPDCSKLYAGDKVKVFLF